MQTQHLMLRLLQSHVEQSNNKGRDPLLSDQALDILGNFVEVLFQQQFTSGSKTNAAPSTKPQIGLPVQRAQEIKVDGGAPPRSSKQFIISALAQAKFVNPELVPSEFVTDSQIAQAKANARSTSADEDVETDFRLGLFTMHSDFLQTELMNPPSDLQLSKATICAPLRSFYGVFGYGDAALALAAQVK